MAHQILCPWDSPGKNTGMSCRALLQGIFPTQGSKPGLPHCRQILYQRSCQRGPKPSLGCLRCLTQCVIEIVALDCSRPDSSVHGILQAGVLEWVAVSSSRGSSRPRGGTHISCTAGGLFTTEPPGKPRCSANSSFACLELSVLFGFFFLPILTCSQSSVGWIHR